MMQFMMMQIQMQRESQEQSRVQQNQQFQMMMLMLGPMRQAPIKQQSTSDHSSFANTRQSLYSRLPFLRTVPLPRRLLHPRTGETIN